jgi:hypothetical protein
VVDRIRRFAIRVAVVNDDFRQDATSRCVETSPTFRAGMPKPLFTIAEAFQSSYDVAPDGKRFLMLKNPPEQAAPDQLNIVVNWIEELRRRLPIGK